MAQYHRAFTLLMSYRMRQCRTTRRSRSFTESQCFVHTVPRARCSWDLTLQYSWQIPPNCLPLSQTQATLSLGTGLLDNNSIAVGLLQSFSRDSLCTVSLAWYPCFAAIYCQDTRFCMSRPCRSILWYQMCLWLKWRRSDKEGMSAAFVCHPRHMCCNIQIYSGTRMSTYVWCLGTRTWLDACSGPKLRPHSGCCTFFVHSHDIPGWAMWWVLEIRHYACPGYPCFGQHTRIWRVVLNEHIKFWKIQLTMCLARPQRSWLPNLHWKSEACPKSVFGRGSTIVDLPQVQIPGTRSSNVVRMKRRGLGCCWCQSPVFDAGICCTTSTPSFGFLQHKFRPSKRHHRRLFGGNFCSCLCTWHNCIEKRSCPHFVSSKSQHYSEGHTFPSVETVLRCVFHIFARCANAGGNINLLCYGTLWHWKTPCQAYTSVFNINLGRHRVCLHPHMLRW